MRKVFAVLLVLALASSSFAVSLSASDLGGGKLRISYAVPTGEILRGVALKLDTTGATIADSSSVIVFPPFNTFPDYAFSNPSGYDIGIGHPLADPVGPGVPSFPASSFSLCMGVLDQGGNKGGATGTGVLCDIQYAISGASATVEISADTYRGGAVVGDAVTQPTLPVSPILIGCYTLTIISDPDNSGCYAPGTVVEICATPDTYYKFAGWTGDTVNIADPSAACTTITMNADATIAATFVKKTCFEMLTAAEQLEYNKYIAAGKTDAQMACWCWKFQCRGDCDGVAYLPTTLKWQIYQSDLNCLIEQWKTTYITTTNPCANFDHAAYLPTTLKWTVYQSDLNVLIAYWKKKPEQLIPCPSYLP